MSILPWRAAQTTSTTGTGTLTLNAAAAGRRSFRDAYGSSARVLTYCISGTTFFEIGFGIYDGGVPGSQTRATVLASSNSNALVSLPAGTADVFAVIDPAMRGLVTGTGGITLALADLGNAVNWTGSGSSTLALPAVASVPPGMGWLVSCNGTGTLTVDPNGAEQINGLTTIAMTRGMVMEILANSDSTAWIGLGNATLMLANPPPIGSGTANTIAGTTGTFSGKVTAADGAATSDLVTWQQFNRASSGAGYSQRFPNGTRMQWGSATSGASGLITVTWPEAFPTAVDSVVATIVGGGSSGYAVFAGSPTTTSTQFVTSVSGVGTSGIGFYWIAMGR